ncbi:hypothetical protein CCACVL1_14072 [Corchorus capsularis]|uniref:Transmembrane protein n=1 Tax=Corchorus capsularis TaxID=210143 RepID=A0A1R3I8C5_COCAP|nr:hypothetical protein CCACVL1_14072 [Corchorus capsularis]
MAGNFKSFFFVLVLVLASLLFSSGARPLNDAGSITKGIEVLIDVLSLEGIKTGGPSSGGEGHAFTKAVTNSGPSPGGKGHAFTDAVTNSGPSSGTDGH